MPFRIMVIWNQASISKGFRECSAMDDLDTTSNQRSRSFILVQIDFSYTTS